MSTRFIFGTPLADLIHTDSAIDPADAWDVIVYGLGGADIVNGGVGRDWIWARVDDVSKVTFSGGDGADVLVSFDGADWLQGDAGADLLISGAGADTLLGGDGNDQLWAGGGDDVGYGGAGADVLVGDAGADFLFGEAGDDILIGGDGADALIGDPEGIAGADQLWGGGGADQLNGGFGADVLVGDAGDDFLDGGRFDLAADYLVGGAGADGFITSGASHSGGVGQVDVVWDFEFGTDRIGLTSRFDVSPGSGYYSIGASHFDAFPSAFGSLSGTLLWSGDRAGIEYGVMFFAGVDLTIDQLRTAFFAVNY